MGRTEAVVKKARRFVSFLCPTLLPLSLPEVLTAPGKVLHFLLCLRFCFLPKPTEERVLALSMTSCLHPDLDSSVSSKIPSFLYFFSSMSFEVWERNKNTFALVLFQKNTESG